MSGTDWSKDEVEATVADYFAMLQLELSGQPYNKAQHNAQLRERLNGRSRSAVEFKHQNVTAILIGQGQPCIAGYKPLPNYQALLADAVLEYLDVYPDFFEELKDGPVLNPNAVPSTEALSGEGVVEEPPEGMAMPIVEWSDRARHARVDFVARDASNRQLGLRGEEFVMEFERRRLHDQGHRDLSRQVEWTAQTRGDGTGYDVRSFNTDRTPRLIEVKTTGLGKHFPFNVTANEHRCSEANPTQFHLYRVFKFGVAPRLYMLPGPLSLSCSLAPTQYKAFVQNGGRG